MFNETSLFQLWGKRDRETGSCYPLIFYMIDTATVASKMWQHCLHVASKDYISNELKPNADEAAKLFIE